MKDTFSNIKYPEFTNKTSNEVMPFNGGFLGSNNVTSFNKLLQIYLELPKKFHYWFGDQVALKKIYDTEEFKIAVLDSNYNYNVKDTKLYDCPKELLCNVRRHSKIDDVRLSVSRSSSSR